MISYRKRLLASTVTTIIGGVALIAPQAASAQCAVAPGTVTCATTTTANTLNLGASPASDRHYTGDTSVAPFTATISSGAIIDGFGLAFTNTVIGSNTLNVINNGTVGVTAGNSPSQGGFAALSITSNGATPIVYSGTGSINNQSVLPLGDGLFITANGSGSILATVGGNITTVGPSSYGAFAQGTGSAGSVTLSTLAGTTVRAGSIGVYGLITNSSSIGALNVTNGGTILSSAGAPNTLDIGLLGNSNGSAAVSVTNNGAIGAALDRVDVGIEATIINASSAATLTVNGSAASTIFAIRRDAGRA